MCVLVVYLFCEQVKHDVQAVTIFMYTIVYNVVKCLQHSFTDQQKGINANISLYYITQLMLLP